MKTMHVYLVPPSHAVSLGDALYQLQRKQSAWSQLSAFLNTLIKRLFDARPCVVAWLKCAHATVDALVIHESCPSQERLNHSTL